MLTKQPDELVDITQWVLGGLVETVDQTLRNGLPAKAFLEGLQHTESG